MKNEKMLKKLNPWFFIVPLLVLSALYTFTVYVVAERRINDNYEHFKGDAADAARHYTFLIHKTSEAKKLIDGLLERKLISAGRTVMLSKGSITQPMIVKLADSLEVDQISVFNKRGVIINSNIEGNIGWMAPEGHPVHKFMKSGKESSIDEIRADTISGLYYKFAYYRLPEGEFVQIGTDAGEIKSFVDQFELDPLLRELAKDPDLDQISFIDKDLTIVKSTKEELNGLKVVDEEMMPFIEGQKEISSISRKGGEIIYNSYIPVSEEGRFFGTLLISTRGNQAAYVAAGFIREIFVALVAGLAVITGLMAMMYSNGKKYLRLAYYDIKSGLPNRESLLFFLNKMSKHKDKEGGLFMIDLSGAAALSMSYGPEYADTVLTEIARNVGKRFEESCTTFRISDERLVIFTDIFKTREKLRKTFEMVVDFFQNPGTMTEGVFMPVKIGVAEISVRDDPTKALKRALIALNRVRGDSYVSFGYFNDDMEAAIARENLIGEEISAGLKDERGSVEIYALFQPQLDLKTEKISGFEVLARMRSQELGSVSPSEFIGIAESKKLIVPLTSLIIKKAAELVKTIKTTTPDPMRVAINISGTDIMRRDFVGDCIEQIKNTGMDFNDIELEITESVLLEDVDSINEKLGMLKDLGIKISLDDFGTGYSSLSELRELNIDVVKIDKKFIDRIIDDPKESLIIPEIISMAHKIGLSVVAEGVETESQKEYLKDAGCDIIQGYLIGAPLSREEAGERVAKGSLHR